MDLTTGHGEQYDGTHNERERERESVKKWLVTMRNTKSVTFCTHTHRCAHTDAHSYEHSTQIQRPRWCVCLALCCGMESE